MADLLRGEAVIFFKNLMKIGINVRHLQKRASGIQNYISGVLRGLIEVDQDNEYVLFVGSHAPVPAGLESPRTTVNVSARSTSTPLRRLFWEQYDVPKEVNRLGLDVFHEPSFIAPAWRAARTLVTIYDLAPNHFPKFYDWRTRTFLNTLIPISTRRCDRIIAISEFTKKDIVETYRVSPEKVDVVYCGYNSLYRQIDRAQEFEQLRGKLGIRQRFVVTVSMISPRKNMVRLIQAFGRRRNRTTDGIQLVVVGTKGWLFEEVFQEVGRCNLEGEVIFAGFLSDEELLTLYNSAVATVYPSLFEGFGIPVAEAMACGSPVVCSNATSLPEVGGDAVEYVDPLSIESIAEGLSKVIENPSLRLSLRNRGLQQASKFSWTKAARETKAVYESM